MRALVPQDTVHALIHYQTSTQPLCICSSLLLQLCPNHLAITRAWSELFLNIRLCSPGLLLPLLNLLVCRYQMQKF